VHAATHPAKLTRVETSTRARTRLPAALASLLDDAD
jgi:hypothetical protein